MKRVMVVLTVLLLAGLTFSATAAFDLTSPLSQLGLSGFGSALPAQSATTGSTPSGSGLSSLSSLGGFGFPTTDYMQSQPTGTTQATQDANSAFGNGWNLNNLQFFSPNNRASAQPVSMIPETDYSTLAQLMAQLPVSDASQAAAPTPTPAPNSTETFTTNVTSTIPADSVIFVEVSRNTLLKDPTNQGMIIPNVTMNYKFSDSDKKLSLKKKAGVDYNASQIYFGFSDSDDVNNRYLFDYGIGSCPGISISVLFHGADGRVRIVVNGVQKDLMPGTKYEVISDQGNTRTTLDVTDWGLIPKSGITIADTI